MRRDPAKAIAVLDAMLQFFDGGRRWTIGQLRDTAGNRCLIGALPHVRREQHIRGSGTEYYLRPLRQPSLRKRQIRPPMLQHLVVFRRK
jgi:hypothetical protein